MGLGTPLPPLGKQVHKTCPERSCNTTVFYAAMGSSTCFKPCSRTFHIGYIHIGYVPTEARSPCAAHGHKRVHTASESLSPSSNLPLGTPGA